MTCCSTESSFLERRCSAITLGLSSNSRGSSRRPSRSEMWEMEPANPGIHIIEATPKTSPCPSERQTHGGVKDHIKMLDHFKRKRNDDNSIDSITEYPDEQTHQYRSDHEASKNVVVVNSNSNIPIKELVSSDSISQQPVIRRAPLASLSSFKMSSIECQDSDGNCSGLDESCADTDDDMEQFSTDSDEISLQTPPPSIQHVKMNGKNFSCLSRENEIHAKLNEASNSTRVHSSGELSKPCENIERQRSNDKLSPRPASCSGCISSRASDKKSISSECVTINVLDYKNDEKPSPFKPSAPSSVILEMPVIAQQSESATKEPQVADPDPSAAETSCKWSKETLF